MTLPISYATQQIYSAIPQVIQDQDATNGYPLYYYIWGMCQSIDILDTLMIDNMGAGVTVSPTALSAIEVTEAYLLNAIGMSDTGMTIFGTDYTWNQITDTLNEFNGYYAMVKSLNPSAWWKLNEPLGSVTVSDSSGNGHNGTVNGDSYDDLVASLNPSAWWKLADAVGSTTALDSSGNGYTGTVIGVVTFGEPGAISGTPSDTAALFNATGGEVTSTVAVSNTSSSINSWFLMPNGNINGAIFVTESSGGYGLGVSNGNFASAGNRLTLNLPFTIDVDAGAAVSPGWHMGTVVIDSSGHQQVYLDGALVYSSTFVITPSTPEFIIGSSGYWTSDIAQVSVFPTALTASQVSALYNAAPMTKGIRFGQNSPITGEVTSTAALFDGSTGGVVTSTVAVSNTSSSINSWFLMPSGNINGTMFNTEAAGGYGLGVSNGNFASAGNRLTLNLPFTIDVDAGAAVSPGWHMGTVVIDSSGHQQVYLDGTLVYSATFAITSSTPEFIIGSSGYWTSDIAQVSVFPTALTASQVSALYNARTIVSTPYDTAVAQLMPSAWWKLADAVGSTTALDSSGNGYTGTVIGVVTFGEPGAISGTPSDTAALFNATGGEVTSTVAVSNTSSSINSWFLMPSGNVNGSMFNTESAGGYGLGVSNGNYASAGNHLTLGLPYTIDADTGAVVSPGWHMGTVVIDSSGHQQVYLDGALVYSSTFVITPSTPEFIIGSSGYWTSDIAQVSVFPTALTASQVLALYNAAPLNPYPNFVIRVEDEDVLVTGSNYNWSAPSVKLYALTRGYDNSFASAHDASNGANGSIDLSDYSGAPGWSQILDLRRCPQYALPWLSQFIGSEISQNNTLTYQQTQNKMATRSGFQRATTASIIAEMVNVINAQLPSTSIPILASQIIALENTEVLASDGGSLGAAITTTSATSITVTNTDSSWGSLGSNSSFVIQVDAEKILVPEGIYNWMASPVTISGVTRGYAGTIAAIHSINTAVSLVGGTVIYGENPYALTILIPSTYYNIYTYSGLVTSAGGAGTYSAVDSYIGTLGGIYGDLSGSAFPTANSNYVNFIYRYRPAGIQVFMGGY